MTIRNLKELDVRHSVAFYGFWFSIVIEIIGILGLGSAFIRHHEGAVTPTNITPCV